MNKNNLKKYGAIAVIALVVVLGALTLRSRADTPQTTLTVLGTPRHTPSAVFEYVADDYHTANSDKVSNVTYPTNVGVDIFFKATASDDNNDDWKLAICRDGTKPTIGSGPSYTPACSSPANTICVSSSFTASGSENTTAGVANCKYTTVVGDAESVGWYAYACDATGCSADVDNQGSKSDGSESPFAVNHRPGFSSTASSTIVQDPGGTYTFKTTSSDSDFMGSSEPEVHDTVKLYVCKTQAFTSGATPGCDVAQWCASSAGASNPECVMSGVSIKDGLYDAYPYIVDEHGFAASGGAQGVNHQAETNNKAPVVSASSIGLFDPLDTNFDGDPILGLTTIAGTTTGFKVKFTSTDANGCDASGTNDETVSANALVYRSGVTAATCVTTPDDDNCYAVSTSDCAITTTCSAGSGTVGWTCTLGLKYHADPTTGSADTDTIYYDQDWRASAQATDDDPATGTLANATSGNELGKFNAFGVTESAIAYQMDGPPIAGVVPGGTSDSATTTAVGKGNTGIYTKVSTAHSTTDSDPPNGVFASIPYMCTDYASDGTGCATAALRIPQAQQKYNASTGFTWADETTNILSDTSTSFLNYCVKPLTATHLPEKATYWKIKVPATQKAGAYTGLNDIVSAMSPTANW